MEKPGGRYTHKKYNDIPPTDGSPRDIDRPTRKSQKKAFDDILLLVFTTCHKYLGSSRVIAMIAIFGDLRWMNSWDRLCGRFFAS